MRALPVVKLLNGQVWQFENTQTRTLVVYWWTSGYPFCAVQSPHIEALWRAQKNNGLQVLALSIDEYKSARNACLKSKGLSFPAGVVTVDVAKMLPKPKGLPVVVVFKIDKVNMAITPEGVAVFAEGGEMFPEDIEGLKKYL